MLIRILRRLRPLRIDFYILSEVFAPFMGGVLFFCFIFLMFQILRLAEFFIVHGVSLGILGEISLLLILTSLPSALPVAFLLGVLVAFGRLSADSELVAMKANGISMGRLAAPVVAFSLVVAAFSLALNMEWVPWCHRTYKVLQTRIANTKVASAIKEGTFNSGFYNLLIYADRMDSDSNRLHRVFVYDEREKNHPFTVVAREGEIVTVKTDDELASTAVLKLYNGNIHRNDAKTHSYEKVDFGEYQVFLKMDSGSKRAALKPAMMSYDELLRQMNRKKIRLKRKREAEAEFWRRFAFALAPVGFAFLGMGFGTVRTRAVRSGAGLTAIVIVLIYWSLQTVAAMLTQKGWMPAYLCMQIPNLVIFLAAAKSFQSARW